MFTEQGTLFAALCDPDRLELLGDPIPVVDQVRFNTVFNFGQYSFSLNGGLIYRAQVAQNVLSIPVWRDRDGDVLSQAGPPEAYSNPAVSPDGKSLAFGLSAQTTQGMRTSIWTQDLERGTRSRLSFVSGTDQFPVWSRDGETIYFVANLGGTFDLFRKPADGSGEAER